MPPATTRAMTAIATSVTGGSRLSREPVINTANLVMITSVATCITPVMPAV